MTEETVKVPKAKLSKIIGELTEASMRIDESAAELAETTGAERKMFVNVTVKVPERLIRILEEQNYFGETKDKFFENSLKAYFGCKVHDMGFDEAEELARKYGAETWTY